MRTLIAGLGALLLTGCVSVTAVNDKGGVVEHARTASVGLKAAEAKCAGSGKTAKVVSFDGLFSTLTFECVAR